MLFNLFIEQDIEKRFFKKHFEFIGLIYLFSDHLNIP